MSTRYADEVSLGVLPVIAGVPQGSIFGPIMFLLYINGLPRCMGNKPSQGYAVGNRSVSWEPDYRFRTDVRHGHVLPPPVITPGQPPPGPLPLYRPPGVPLVSRPSNDNGSVIRDGSIDGIQRLEADERKLEKSQPGTNDSGYFTTSNNNSSGRGKTRASNPVLNEPIYGPYQPPLSPHFMGAGPPGPYGPRPMMAQNPHMMFPYGPGHVVPYPGSQMFAPVSPDGRKKRGWKKKHKLSKSQISLYQPDPRYGMPMGPYPFMQEPPNRAILRAQSFDNILASEMRPMQHPYASEFATLQRPIIPNSPPTGRAGRRPTPDGQEKAEENSAETSSETSKVVKAELHHSADATKPKVRDAIYETLKQGKLETGPKPDAVKISPEAKAIMDRNANILGMRLEEKKLNDPSSAEKTTTKKPSATDKIPDEKASPSAVSVDSGRGESSKNDASDSSEKENVIEAVLVPCPPKRQKHKSKALFPAIEAWDRLNVSEELSQRHIGPKTPEETVSESFIVPKMVATPPPRRQNTEPIYLEYDDRLLPEFKKRLIETGSFDFVPEKRSIGSQGSGPQKNKSSRNGSEPMLDANISAPKKNWKFGSNDKAYYPAQTEKSHENEKTKNEDKPSGLEQIKNSVVNVFRRTRSQEKILEGSDSQDKSLHSTDQKTNDNSVIDFSWVDDLEHKFHSSNVDQELLRQQREQMMKNENIDVYGTIAREKDRVEKSLSIPIGESEQQPSISVDPPAVRNVYRQFEQDVGATNGFSQGYVKRQLDDSLANQNPAQLSPNQGRFVKVTPVNQHSPIRDMTSREAMMENHYFEKLSGNTGPVPPEQIPDDRHRKPLLEQQTLPPRVRRTNSPPERMILEHNPLHMQSRSPAVDRRFPANGDSYGYERREADVDRHRRHLNFDAPVYKHTRGRSESDLLNQNEFVAEHSPMGRNQMNTSAGHLTTERVPVTNGAVPKAKAKAEPFIPPPDYDTEDIPQFEVAYGSVGSPRLPPRRRPADLEIKRQNWNNSWDYPTPTSSATPSSPYFYQGQRSNDPPASPYAMRRLQADRNYGSTEFYRKNVLPERNRQHMKAMKKHGFEKVPGSYY